MICPGDGVDGKPLLQRCCHCWWCHFLYCHYNRQGAYQLITATRVAQAILFPLLPPHLSPLPHTCPPMHVLCLTEIKIKCEKAKGCCSCFSSDIIVFTFILWTFMWSWHLQHPLCIFSLVADVKPSSLFLCLFVDAALFRSQFYRCLCSCLF